MSENNKSLKSNRYFMKPEINKAITDTVKKQIIKRYKSLNIARITKENKLYCN